ncbi:IclR family transcriptional regulator [Paraburkholderia sprentiae WSM5005]|uniref:IclR family transcriptional regulator n=1 Tax=Paraburkholderia sprentiae WSM5005 TaxID=754502 RepID=A0A1I9YQG0_9BURK|nr:IclR family transcriptional regulator [Paraburkholderia sprentiae]APA88419.1 IclR family transcriptional regulator [Paraburkholderia sprentiae WSM5005]
MVKSAADESPGHTTADASVEKKQRGIQSVEVGGRLLEALARHRVPLGLTELAGEAQLPSAQAHTYLVSLTRLGLVKRDALTGNYELGPLSLRLGLMHIEQQPVYRIAASYAPALAERIGFSVAICVAGAQGPTIVRYERGGFPLHVNLHIGTVMSLEATSTGRIFCAFYAREQVGQMARSQALAPDASSPGDNSARTPVVDAQWSKRFDAIRARGIERGIDVPSPGISSLSVPVFDAQQRMQLALTAIGSSGSIDVGWDGEVARQLIETTRQITEALVASN